MARKKPLRTMFDPMDLLPPTPSLDGPGASRSGRVRTVDTGGASKKDEARVQIEISVQSIAFTAEEQESNSQEGMYLQTMLHFYCLVESDFDAVLSCVQQALQESYDCKNLTLRAEGSLLFTLTMPRGKLVSLQCDQSSGQLADMIDSCMITKDLLHELRVTHVQLSTEVKNRDLGYSGAVDILDT